MLAGHRAVLDDLLTSSARTLISAHEAIPLEQQMQSYLKAADNAQNRGYYTPEEDEALREAYRNYLGVRASLWSNVEELLVYIDLPRKFKKGDWQAHLTAFAIAFSGAAILIRSGYYLIDAASASDIVRAKLDEAEPRYGIERKQFTQIYDALMSTRVMARYHRAYGFYLRNKAEIFGALSSSVYQNADLFDNVARILEAEEPYLQTRFKDQVRRKAKFNIFSLRRRRLSAVAKTMFFMFETLGSEIADLKQPLVKSKGAPKRVGPDVQSQLLACVRPGDIFITRHDDAMSNLFLPGFWPHAALYIGSDQDRAAMGVAPANPRYQSAPGEVRFLESKKDGVLFRPFGDTLQIDACTVLRPRLGSEDLSAALTRALSHSGKLYDFVFDFASADRLACTELIYRAYNGFGPIDFQLHARAGRQCLSAEDLLNQGLSQNWFDVVALFGVGNDLMFHGEEAHKRLIDSYEYAPV